MVAAVNSSSSRLMVMVGAFFCLFVCFVCAFAFVFILFVFVVLFCFCCL